MLRARRAVPACKPERALQGRAGVRGNPPPNSLTCLTQRSVAGVARQQGDRVGQSSALRSKVRPRSGMLRSGNGRPMHSSAARSPEGPLVQRYGAHFLCSAKESNQRKAAPLCRPFGVNLGRELELGGCGTRPQEIAAGSDSPRLKIPQFKPPPEAAQRGVEHVGLKPRFLGSFRRQIHTPGATKHSITPPAAKTCRTTQSTS